MAADRGDRRADLVAHVDHQLPPVVLRALGPLVLDHDRALSRREVELRLAHAQHSARQELVEDHDRPGSVQEADTDRQPKRADEDKER